MPRRSAIVVLGLALVSGLVAAFVWRATPPGRVYAVDEVQFALQRNPRAWVGHTVLVRSWSTATASGMSCTTHITPASCQQVWLLLTPTFPYAGPPALAFSVLLPRGSTVPTGVDEGTDLSMSLHTLPGMGSSILRWSGSRTLRVRLTTSAALCATPPPCGVLVP